MGSLSPCPKLFGIRLGLDGAAIERFVDEHVKL